MTTTQKVTAGVLGLVATAAVLTTTLVNKAVVNPNKFTVDTLMYTGNPLNRINLIVCGDGFTATGQDTLKNSAKAQITNLFNSYPFNTRKNLFNVFLVHVISAQTGCTHPDLWPTGQCNVLPAQPKLLVNTYFGCSFDQYSTHRYIEPTKTGSLDSIYRYNFPWYVPFKTQNVIPIIICNTPFYGGGEYGSTVTTTLNPQTQEVMLHELGHAFAGLDDEYIYQYEGWNNTSVSVASQTRWAAWVPPCGAFACAGGGHTPLANCKMRSLGQPFCPVCLERFTYAFDYFTNSIDSYTPTNTSTISLASGQQQIFTINTLKPIPNCLNVVWQLDGKTVSGDNFYTIQNNLVSSGSHKLTVTVSDTSHLAKITLPVHTVSWTINTSTSVIPPPPPPPAPTPPTGLVIGNGQSIPVTCNAVTGAISYTFMLSNGVIIKSATPSITLTGLSAKTGYSITVSVVTASGTSIQSTPINFTTP